MSNRVRAITAHGYRYAFDMVHRLSADIGISQSTLQRLISGEGAATEPRMRRITELLSADLRLPISLRVEDVFSEDGTYEEPSTCALCDCDGCYPEGAHDIHGVLLPRFRRTRPGDWCRYPGRANDPARTGEADPTKNERPIP